MAGGCRAIPGPFESWLVLRGLKTLPLRIERASATALAVASYLAAHPRVTAVHYPGLAPSAAARSQLTRGYGPLLSFEISGHRCRRGRGGRRRAADRPRDQLRRGRVVLGAARPLARGNRAAHA